MCVQAADVVAVWGQNEEWIFAQTQLGINTYYQMNPNGSIRVKLEGHAEGCQVFDMVRIVSQPAWPG
jgi:hypothetical protein